MRDKDQILLEQIYSSIHSRHQLTEADVDIENYILTEGLLDDARRYVQGGVESIKSFFKSGIGKTAQRYFVPLLLAATAYQVPSFINLANSPEQKAQYGDEAVAARGEFQTQTAFPEAGEKNENLQWATVVFNAIRDSKNLSEDQKKGKLAALIETAKKETTKELPPGAFKQLANQINNELLGLK